MEEEQASAQPERQVFLREGTIVLRWLFGYLNKRNLPGWTKPLRWPHTLSTWLPKKPKTRFREATLIDIDIDGVKEQDGIPVQFHIGISILHTKHLHNEPLPFTESQAKIIRSFHWVVQDPNYFDKNENRFCFDEHRCIPLSSLEECLKKLLGPHYPLILVVHGISRERIVLRKLNIDLNPIFIIDTTKAARYPLQEFHDSTLKKFLQGFDIPFTGRLLHFTGNDAHFILRLYL
jgi:hypothetical protein